MTGFYLVPDCKVSFSSLLPQPCIGKILDVLTSYHSAVDSVATVQSCSGFVSEVKPAMDKLHNDLSRCVKSKAEVTHQKVSLSSTEDSHVSASGACALHELCWLMAQIKTKVSCFFSDSTGVPQQ